MSWKQTLTAPDVQAIAKMPIGNWGEDSVQATAKTPIGNWGEDLVQAIAKTPIGNWGEDFWVWELEKNGNFSVQSAHKILSRRHSYEPSSSGTAGNVFWNKLWKLSVPPRVRNFRWRVIRGFVPCKSVLLTRHIEKIPFCNLCGKEKTITMLCSNALGRDSFGRRGRS